MGKDNDKKQTLGFCLRGSGQVQTERLFVFLMIGLFNSLELGLIGVNEFHATLFNPRTLKHLEDLNVDADIIDLCHRSLFLEDVEQMFPPKILDKNILELKEFAIQILAKTKFDPRAENQWFVKY